MRSVFRSALVNELIIILANNKHMDIYKKHHFIPKMYVVVVVLLFYVHGKHLRSCRDGQLT